MQRVVLLGGGHAHLFVVEAAARLRAAGAAVTLVSESRLTPYSGMLPGVLAGRRAPEAMMIDLAALCARHGVEFVEARIEGFDRAARAARLADGATLAGDLVTFDLGVVPDLAAIDGAADHALPVKPIAAFLDAFARLADDLAAGRVRAVAVIGAGAAGVECACAIRARVGVVPRVALIDPDGPLATMNPGLRRRAAAALARRRVDVVRGRTVAVTGPGVTLADGAPIDRNTLSQQMASAGIGTSVHWLPLHMHPYYRETYGYRAEDYPVAAGLYPGLVTLPLYPDMGEGAVELVCANLKELVRGG